MDVKEVHVSGEDYEKLLEAVSMAKEALENPYWRDWKVHEMEAMRPGLLNALDTIDDCLGTTTLKQTQRAGELRTGLEYVWKSLAGEALERGPQDGVDIL
jgi:hypothetical protein